ncbi:MAG: metallophosphoesterase [Anaerolineales bacterium]
MHRKATIFTAFSLIIAFAFTAITLLLYPLWGDVSTFLSTNFPVMLAASIWGGLSSAALLYWLETKTFGRRWQYILFSITDVAMIGLLGYLLYQLGTERSVLRRQFIVALPYALWFGAIILYLWFMPRWKVLQSRKALVPFLIVLGVSALVWFNLPFQFEFTSRPVAFIQNGGVVVTWGTNMTATGQVNYSLDGSPAQTISHQTFGLRDVGDRIVRVFLPISSDPVSLSFTAASEGIRAIHPISMEKAGRLESETVTVPFPSKGDDISFVSFSDIHERADVYNSLAAHIPWNEMDLAVYNGDLLNSTVNPEQVTHSILGLSTGGLDLPRLFVRDNHETRNEGARLLDDWMLPTGGTWYQAFTFGNTFFIVLDCGEDKLDDHQEYGGLVDFTSYQKEQAAWLDGVLKSPEFQQAQYQIVITHMPLFGEEQEPPAFEPVASLLRNNQDIDLMLNGHTHIYGIFSPEESGLPYPVAFSGGPEMDSAAAVVVNMTANSPQVKIIDTNGTIVEQLP